MSGISMAMKKITLARPLAVAGGIVLHGKMSVSEELADQLIASGAAKECEESILECASVKPPEKATRTGAVSKAVRRGN